MIGIEWIGRGVPHGAPPVGELRWRETMPVMPWTGVRDAVDYGPPCAQAARGWNNAIAAISLCPGPAIDGFLYCVALATGNGFVNCFLCSSIQPAARRSASAISARFISPASFVLSVRLISIT